MAGALAPASSASLAGLRPLLAGRALDKDAGVSGHAARCSAERVGQLRHRHIRMIG
jgi:hypothetical protein